jgi:RNA polymerase sigma-70 factor (ECF subfamily)
LHLNKINPQFLDIVPQDKYTHITDSELLQLFYNDKDNKWVGILLQRYTLLLLGTCMKYLKNEEEAKDSVQQIFLKVIGELEKYKVDYFKSWIYMIARNHCLMKLRNKNIIISADELIQLKSEEDSKELQIEKEKMLTFIESSITELNTEQKTCITLFYIEKKTYLEIVENTGYNLMQVKSNIQNGKRNMKISVEKKMKIS